jgi:polysaccharide export outer membrane protein
MPYHLHRLLNYLVLGILLVGLLSLIACSHGGSDGPSHYDAFIKSGEDVHQLQQLEAQLTVTPEKAALHPDYQIINNISVPFVPEYRMGPGDVVEIVYHIKYEKTNTDYQLEVQDRISINFPYHPQFNSSVLVRTDGKITLPLIGDVAAESRTPMELSQLLNQVYRKYFNKTDITVALEEFNVKIAELKKAITTAPRGQSKVAPIAPDGRIAFPLIGSLQAQGFTLIQLEKMVNESYSKQVRNLNATLILLEIHHPKLYVLGEVERPGAYDITSVSNIFNALTLSGGFKKSGELEEVAVFRNDGLERPIALKIDIKTAFKTGMALTNIKLRPGDIVYVPRSRIDERNDIIEKIFTKGIWAVLPFSTSLSATYNWDRNVISTP